MSWPQSVEVTVDLFCFTVRALQVSIGPSLRFTRKTLCFKLPTSCFLTPHDPNFLNHRPIFLPSFEAPACFFDPPFLVFFAVL